MLLPAHAHAVNPAPTTTTQQQLFYDVPASHPFFTEVNWVARMGVAKGDPGQVFGASRSVSRGAMAAFLYRFSGETYTPPARAQFTDVPTTHPFYREISWMAAKRITSGYKDGTFRPNASVSREVMAVFLYRFAGVSTSSVTPTFSDVGTSHRFAKEIAWLASTGITKGYPDGTFGATRWVARDATAAFLYRYADHSSRVGGVRAPSLTPVSVAPVVLAWTPGMVKPTARNTGVPAGTQLRAHRGDIVVTQPGTVIQGLDVYGFITVRTSDVTIRNTRVRGSGPGSFNTGLINANHRDVRNLVIEDVTLLPDFPSVWINGVIGHDFTARRVNASRVVDGFNIYNIHGTAANVRVESSYVHNLSYFSPDPNHSDNQTHNDAIQIQGGSNITIVGNTLSAWLAKDVGTQNYRHPQAGFGIIVTPNVNAVTGAVVEHNWFDGSYIPFKIESRSKVGPMDFGRIAHNRFARDMRNVQMNGVNQWFTILMTPDTTAETVGNVYDDDNSPVEVRRDSGTSTAP